MTAGELIEILVDERRGTTWRLVRPDRERCDGQDNQPRTAALDIRKRRSLGWFAPFFRCAPRASSRDGFAVL